jgi:SPP1 family phage portal protein
VDDLKDIANKIVCFHARQSEYRKLKDYYDNITKINFRHFDDLTKPNNRIGHPFAEIIVKSATSYFTGEPIKVQPHKKDRQKELDRIHLINDVDDVNSELDRLSNIYGHAFEIHWNDTVNGKNTPRFKAMSPQNVMLFHSMEIDEEPIAAVVWTNHNDAATNASKYSATLYTPNTSQKFSFNLSGDSIQDILPQAPSPHTVGYLPVIEYLNNEDRTSSFEKVIGLIDAYNTAQSDTVNDIEYWADSYLVLNEMSGTDSEDIARMKRDRVLLIDGSGSAEFLNKQTNDKHLENFKDRLTSDIHKFSQVPNLHDEQFAANLSGTAIRMKIKDLEDKVSEKEMKFNKGFRKRYEIIFATLDKVALEQTTDFVEFVYTRNIPMNLVEIADMVAKAPEGLWSKKTLRTLYAINYKEEAEAAQIKKEQEEANNAMATVDPFKVDPKEHPLGSNQSPSGQGGSTTKAKEPKPKE